MSTKDLIRASVIKTNPYWPFSLLNKIPYNLAVRTFLQECNKFPQIKSVYLKHSFTDGTWVAGLSDIDWSLVIDDNLRAKDELAFLNAFWNNYHRIKRFFPMLGEGEIFLACDLNNMASLGVQVYESQRWKRVLGVDCRSNDYKYGDLERDIAYSIFYFYYIHLTGKFFSVPRRGMPSLAEFNRITDKIIKYINNSNCIKKLNFHNIFEAFGYAIKELDEFSSNNYKLDLNGTADLEISVKNDDAREKECEAHVKQKLLFINQALSKYAGIIDETFIMGRRRMCILLQNNLCSDMLNKFLAKLRDIFLEPDIKADILYPYVFTENMLKSSIKLFNPFWYYYINDTILCGKNVLDRIGPPGRYFLINSALRHAVSLSQAIRKEPQGNESYLNWIGSPSLDYLLREMVRIRLFLEKGIIITYDMALSNAWKTYYYDSYADFIKADREKRINPAISAQTKFSVIKKLMKDLGQITHRQSQETQPSSLR